MYTTVFGFRVNLIYVAIFVACYDLIHIVFELYERFERFLEYEADDLGCLDDLFQLHCQAVYSEITIYVIDFFFTVFMIRGAFEVKTRDSFDCIDMKFLILAEIDSGPLLAAALSISLSRLYALLHAFLWGSNANKLSHSRNVVRFWWGAQIVQQFVKTPTFDFAFSSIQHTRILLRHLLFQYSGRHRERRNWTRSIVERCRVEDNRHRHGGRITHASIAQRKNSKLALTRLQQWCSNGAKTFLLDSFLCFLFKVLCESRQRLSSRRLCLFLSTACDSFHLSQRFQFTLRSFAVHIQSAIIDFFQHIFSASRICKFCVIENKS